MACPVCKSNHFYVKDPADEFEIYEFEYRDGRMQFADPQGLSHAPEIEKDGKIYCQRCSWHGKKSQVQ
jgi:uncharacterized protein YbaR (Trm112 family)